MSDVELPWDRLEAELIWIAEDRLGGFQSGWCAAKAERALRQLRGEADEDAPKEWVAAYHNDELDEETRMSWLSTNGEFDMALALKWKVHQEEWREGSSPRLRWLDKEFLKIWNADDPFAAIKLWISDPPAPPARLRAA